MPVFLFALSQSRDTTLWHFVGVFGILHLLIYPASNGYNSYIDRDTEPIGGLEAPPEPPRLLWYTTWFMDLLGWGLAWLVSATFALFVGVCIVASRAYSAPWPRLKKYPLLSFLLVASLQGGWTYLMVLSGLNPMQPILTAHHLWAALAASFLIGASYPLTQIYQHRSDAERGDMTLSRLLGLRGTLVFSATCFGLASGILFGILPLQAFLLLQLSLLPALIYFARWTLQIWQNPERADFQGTMKMSTLSALSLGVAFILMNWIQS